MNLAARLKAQNNGKAWLSCSARGRAHRLVRGKVRDYWTCVRCPVDIRKPEGRTW